MTSSNDFISTYNYSPNRNFTLSKAFSASTKARFIKYVSSNGCIILQIYSKKRNPYENLNKRYNRNPYYENALK